MRAGHIKRLAIFLLSLLQLLFLFNSSLSLEFYAAESKTVLYISIQTEPTKTIYYKGEALDTSGMRIVVYYTDLTKETISSGYTTSGYNPNTAGTQTVTVWYNNFKTTFSVNVLTPEIRLSQSDVSIKSGEIITLTAVTVPDGRTVTWVSSDTNILNVNAGKITAISVGNAVVTAEFVYNGAVYSDLCKVAVERNILLGDINEDGKINLLDLGAA